MCMFVLISACAQQKKYISYKVKEGESVKEIAKRYDVKSRDIMRLNPDLKRKPEANTLILIPNVDYDAEAEAKRAAAEVSASQNHIVQPKETLYGISKHYNVSMDALEALNPAIETEGLKIGMVLQIPQEKMLTPEQVKQNELDYLNDHFVLHTVVKDDTEYSLTRHYNVSRESLLQLNPELSEGLKLGMLLKIKEKVSEAELKESAALIFNDSVVFKDTVDVAMLLPFKFAKNDTLTKEQLFTTNHNLISIITDFYLGADIAIDSIRKQGVPVRVSVYDSQNDRDTIKSYIKAGAFEKTDVVFGPVFNKHVNYFAGEVKDIPVVFPFYSANQKSFIKDNIVKTVTSREVLKENVLTHFTDIYTNEQIVVVGDEKASSRSEYIEIREFLKEHHDSIKEVHYIQPENGYISQERFVQEIDTLGVNWVILTSNNKVVTADVINNLRVVPNDPEVRLFAFEKAANFDKVDNNMLAKLNFVYASSGVLVDTLPGVKSFYAQYERKNFGYPSEYASKGFDIVYDVLKRMVSNDSLDLWSSFDKGISKRVRSTFEFSQKAYGEPAYNKAVYVRKYNEDLSIDIIQLERDKEKNDEKSDIELELNTEAIQENDSIQVEELSKDLE